MVVRRRGAKKGQAYLKINESEIADDYPEPEQYVNVRNPSSAAYTWPASAVCELMLPRSVP